MGVQLNIKDAETIRLARKLADATGLPVTQAIRAALERDLLARDEAISERVRAAYAIIQGSRELWKPEFDGEELSITHADRLYDERGLPK